MVIEQHPLVGQSNNTLWKEKMDDYNLGNLCKQINELCDEKFSVTFHGTEGIVTLYNGDIEITEDLDFEVQGRLMQIAKENGVSMMLE